MPLPFDLSSIGQGATDFAIKGLTKLWPSIDVRGRSLAQAIDDAIARASAKAWNQSASEKAGLPSLPADGIADLRALLVSTVITRGVLLDPKRTDPNDKRFADLQAQTWIVLARRAGYNGETVAQQAPNAGTQANIELVGILAIVLGAIVIAGVIAYVCYKTSEVIERALATKTENQEMMRLHAESQKIIDNHIAQEQKAGHSLPYTPDELAILDQLHRAQEHIAELVAPPPPAPPPGPGQGAWDVALIAGVLGVLGLGYFFLRKK